jgi:hypothetical protein
MHTPAVLGSGPFEKGYAPLVLEYLHGGIARMIGHVVVRQDQHARIVSRLDDHKFSDFTDIAIEETLIDHRPPDELLANAYGYDFDALGHRRTVGKPTFRQMLPALWLAGADGSNPGIPTADVRFAAPRR